MKGIMARHKKAKKQRTINKRILLLCEDEKSAKNYFESFKKDDKFKRNLAAVDVEVIHPTDFSPLGLIDKAIERRKESRKENIPLHYIWVILDKDKHANLNDAYHKAVDINIYFGLSIICFELWFLLHFHQTAKCYHNCDELIKDMPEEFKEYSKGKNYYDLLRDTMDTAIKNGLWLEEYNLSSMGDGMNMCDLGTFTNLHHLVAYLKDPDAGMAGLSKVNLCNKGKSE
jgi:hypothetical protein